MNETKNTLTLLMIVGGSMALAMLSFALEGAVALIAIAFITYWFWRIKNDDVNDTTTH